MKILTLLTALLLAPLTALHAADRADFVREPQVVIQHGVNDGRYFIGPGMFVLKDGSVLMAAPWGRPPANVFEGIVNKQPVPMLYRSTDAGETWQELGRPEVKWRHSGFVSDGGVTFLRLQDGRIALALHRHAAGLKGGALPVICFSSDEGKTWTDPTLIGSPADEGAWYVMNDRLIQTRAGRLVLPVAHAVGRYEGDRDESLVFFSDDGGATWRRSQPAPLPEGPRGMAEPCVVELKDGRLMLLARGGLGVLVKSYSSDGGETWTQGARTTLVSPCSSLTLHRLPDSRLIVFYNHATPYNAGDFFPRNPLCYALSADEGDSWSGPVIIDDSGVSDGSGGKPSLQIVYPGAAFLKEGILLFYSRDVTKNTFKTTKGETFVWTEVQRALTGGVTCLLAYPDAATKSKPVADCDICIYGGTSGGVVAAVQAARMGKSVVLIEPGRHLGSMMAGGLSWSDVGSAEKAKLFGGLAREVYERIGKHYGQDPKTVFDVTAPEGEGRSRKGVDFIRPPSLAFEPKVAEKVFTEMAREAGVQVRFGAAIESVAKEGTRLQKLKLNDGTAIAAKVFIDATYEGDLMALAGVSYTLGRESNAQYDEKGNGVCGPERGPSNGRFTVKVDPFVKPGDPASELLPLITGDAPEPVGSADKRIQSYNYRLCLTDDPANRVPLDPPANYDASHWELLGRYIEAMKAGGARLTLRNFCKYDPLPNRKYDFNNRWPISTDLLGGADGWPEGSAADRARIAKAHEDYLRGFFHFLRTDPRVPENVREETAQFGLPGDEFIDNGHWPHQIYVREARRMVSDLVMTEHHIRNERVAPRPVSLATYPMDIHAVRRVFHEGKLYNEGFGEGSGKPAPVGYGAIVPKASECENLFVTFALSASHAAFGSIRMEPVFMVTSQSAATAAVLAIDDGVPVQTVDYAKLKTRLLADKQILDPSGAPPAAESKQGGKTSRPRGLVLDDTTATFTGIWAFSSKITPLLGTTYRTAEPKKAATAVFTPEIPVAGRYEVRVLYTAAANRATKAAVTVQTAGGEKTFTVNQRLECLVNGIPRPLGVFDFPKGKITVALSNKSADGFVALDGLQLVPEDAAKAERAKQPMDSTPAAPVKIPPPMLLKSAAKPQEVNGKSYDLVVIGGTPGGIACAVRAAREGLSVLLVNHTQHLGGFVTSGAGGWEAPYDGLRSPIYGEMLTGAAQYYAKTYGEGSPQHVLSMPSKTSRAHIDRPKIEPRIAEMLFNQMVEKEKTLIVLLGHIVTNAERDGALLTSVTLKPMHGESMITVRGKIFADGMYEGDLMAAAGVKTQIGRESRAQYGEKHAGVIYTKDRHKQPGQRGFPRAADEGALNIRYNSHASAEIVEGPHSGEADGSVMAYNYRLILTRDPANRIMVEKPANYDPALAEGPAGLSIVPNLPNQKIAWNGGRLIGPQNEYPGSDWATRERVSRHYLDTMLMRLWWVQNDPEASAGDRKAFAGYGLAADEFPDNGHVPYEIYVREARRLVGRYVFKEQDNIIAEGIARTPVHADSIAMTDWPLDSVACLPRKAPGGSTDGILFLAEESRPAQVPYRSILASEVNNLLVPVALSASHVGWGSIRLEPVWMQLGESAGHAAALAVKGKTTPAALDADLLIRKLATSRMMIAFFNDVDVASDDPRIAAAQYFGTKGFFASYDAKLDAPLTAAVKAAWQDGFENLRKGTLEPMQLAKAVHDAEAQASPATGQMRGDFLLAEFNRIKQSR